MLETRRLTRRLPIGAEPSGTGVSFRLWAPSHRSVAIHIEQEGVPQRRFELAPEGAGYFSGTDPGSSVGVQYRISLDGSNRLLPDPASRFQPGGPQGPTETVDPAAYEWHDHDWRGVSATGQVLYEMHIGTFTPDGTWDAARGELPQLAELGVTAIELMPVAEFPGDFGWSYDGANLFAPSHLYGSPDAMRRFVDAAHGLEIGVILDVVYNHLGRIGEQILSAFTESYFSRKQKTEWGRAINFDEEDCRPVREFLTSNLRHWISEYHLDGARIDATQAFTDSSPKHMILELARTAREAAEGRQVLLVGESEPQQAALLRTAEKRGFELDMVWSDDFHHAARVRLTGRSEAYYSDYRGTAEEFAAAAKWGYLFQGQRYAWQQKSRGTPALDIRPERFVHYLQNHDQVANSPRGRRIQELTSASRLRAMTALWLLMPQTPLIFQGQEFGASSPFFYFNDCGTEERVAEGRAKFLSQFRSFALPEIQEILPDPTSRTCFERSKLNRSERSSHAEIYQLHRDLLRLRRELARHDPTRLATGTIGDDALILRYFPYDLQTRLLIVNFGRELWLRSIAQPLVAPPAGGRWSIEWSSETPVYGGSGTPDLDTDEGWRIPGEAAVMLVPIPVSGVTP